jgi:hypothetical protein
VKQDIDIVISILKGNTLIGVDSVGDFEKGNLGDFEIVELNINDKTGKVTFRP